MAGQDASRFDDLFESDDVDHDATVDAVPDATDTTAPPRRSWSSIAVLVAVVVGAGLGAVVLWPRTAGAGRIPAAVTTTVPQAPVPTSNPVLAPPLPEPLSEPATTAAQEPLPPVPVPVVEAPATPAAPPSRQMPAPTPTLRVPMSVSPTPRPAFPNQHPDPGSDGHGGLLGTGLL